MKLLSIFFNSFLKVFQLYSIFDSLNIKILKNIVLSSETNFFHKNLIHYISYIYIFHLWQAILLPTVSHRITRLAISQRLMINLSRMEKRGWIDDTVRGCGVTIVDSGITVISDDLCVDKIRDGGHRCRPVESSRWHWSEGFNRGPRLVRSPRTSWLSNLGHGARYAFILDSYAFHTGRFTSSVVPLFFFLFFLLLLLPIKSFAPMIVATRFAMNLWTFDLSCAKNIFFKKYCKLFQISRRVRSGENWSFSLWMYLNIHKDIENTSKD